MQRSRRALLQRRAAIKKCSTTGRKRLHKVSLSLVFASWVLFFLLSSLISHGDGCGDEQGTAAAESSCHEDLANSDKQVDHGDTLGVSDPSFKLCNENNWTLECGTGNNNGELVANGHKTDLLSVENEIIPEVETGLGVKEENDGNQRVNRLSRIAPLGLDEFKNKAIAAKGKVISSQTGTVVHRVEPGGKEYNYASASKGAKVLDFNKEAKGASNMLDKDKDKYLRNPCSAEGKFVVIELSEETLVDTIEIGNFEHYSSNIKDFELLSSLVYPTDNWEKLGNFTAANVKHAQRFSLPEPKWARYLKLNLLSHYGSEFYCILSVVEVYGVDAVERMLEDMIPAENRRLDPDAQIPEQMPLQESTDRNDPSQEQSDETDYEPEDERTKKDPSKKSVPDPLVETRTLQVGRIPGDTVLKVLMQKIQSLDVNFSVLERFLEELSSRYGQIFKDFDDDILNKALLIEKIKNELKNLQSSQDASAHEIEGILAWKLIVSSQLDQLIRANAALRFEVENVQDKLVDMENRSLAVIFLSFVFGCLAIFKLFIGLLLSIFRIRTPEHFCVTSWGWFVLLLSSSVIASIMVL